MADYCTKDQILEAGLKLSEQDQASIDDLITRISRMMDRACHVEDDHFIAAASGASASSRDFAGDGTNYLRIDPYTSLSTVTMPTGYTVPDYIEEQSATGEHFLVRVYGDNETRFAGIEAATVDLWNVAYWGADDIGWPDGIKVTVSAIWGRSGVPSEVEQACIEWVVSTLRGRDQAFAKVVNLENGQVITTDMPARARMVADSYRRGRMVFA
ncbi:MAG: hypothetical protein ACO24O_08700 [Arenimonas sp.]